MRTVSAKAHGQIRRGQMITTWGPGALIDMPHHAAVMGGLETWPGPGKLEEVLEPRLSRKLEAMTQVPFPHLYAPPAADSAKPWETQLGVGAWRFPEWFLVQEDASKQAKGGTRRGQRRMRGGSRRLVHRKALDDRGRFDNRPVVPTVHVRACPRGHLDDLDWRAFVHSAPVDGKSRGSGSAVSSCRRQLWLDQTGTAGDLGELVVRCECGDACTRRWQTRRVESSVRARVRDPGWAGTPTRRATTRPGSSSAPRPTPTSRRS